MVSLHLRPGTAPSPANTEAGGGAGGGGSGQQLQSSPAANGTGGCSSSPSQQVTPGGGLIPKRALWMPPFSPVPAKKSIPTSTTGVKQRPGLDSSDDADFDSDDSDVGQVSSPHKQQLHHHLQPHAPPSAARRGGEHASSKRRNGFGRGHSSSSSSSRSVPAKGGVDGSSGIRRLELEALLDDGTWHPVELTDEDGCHGTFLATPVARCGGRGSLARGGGESGGESDSMERALPGASWVPLSHVRPLSLPLPSRDSPVRVGQTLLAERKNGAGGGAGGGAGVDGGDDNSNGARACKLIDCEVLGFAGQGSERMYQVIFLHGDDCGHEDWVPAKNLREICSEILSIQTLRDLVAKAGGGAHGEAGASSGTKVSLGRSGKMQGGRSEGGRGKWGKLEKAEKVSAARLQCPDRSSIPHSLTETSSQLWQGRVTFSRRPPHASYWWPEALDVFIDAEAAKAGSGGKSRKQPKEAVVQGCFVASGEPLGDVASLDTLHVHCMGSGIHADMRAEGILQVSEHKGSQSIRVRGEFGCLGLCQFAKDCANNRNKLYRASIIVTSYGVSIHEYLTGEKWVRNSIGGNKKGAAKGDAAGESSKGKAEARGCVASSVSFSGAPKHPAGWNGVSGGDWGLNGSDVMLCSDGEDGNVDDGGDDDGDDVEVETLSETWEGEEVSGGGKSLRGMAGRSRGGARVEDDGESSGWEDDDVRPLLTRGCKAAMALSDVLRPYAFKEGENEGLPEGWRESLACASLRELGQSIKQLEGALKPTVMSKGYEADVKRPLLHLLGHLNSDLEAAGAVHTLALHIAPSAFSYMPPPPAPLPRPPTTATPQPPKIGSRAPPTTPAGQPAVEVECDLDPPPPTPASQPVGSALDSYASAISQDAEHEVEIPETPSPPKEKASKGGAAHCRNVLMTESTSPAARQRPGPSGRAHGGGMPKESGGVPKVAAHGKKGTAYAAKPLMFDRNEGAGGSGTGSRGRGHGGFRSGTVVARGGKTFKVRSGTDASALDSLASGEAFEQSDECLREGDGDVGDFAEEDDFETSRSSSASGPILVHQGASAPISTQEPGHRGRAAVSRAKGRGVKRTAKDMEDEGENPGVSSDGDRVWLQPRLSRNMMHDVPRGKAKSRGVKKQPRLDAGPVLR